MPRLRTTVGQLLVNEALPEDLRNYKRTLDKKELSNLLTQLAEKHPDQYREVSHALANIGRRVAYRTGGNSFGVRHLRPSPAAVKIRQQIAKELQAIEADDSLTDDQRENKIIATVGRLSETQAKDIYDEQLAADNPLAKQVLSGSRGNPMNLASLLGSDMTYVDHRGRPLPIPVLKSYAQGLSPAEYFAGSYGARAGIIDTKFCLFAETQVLMADFTAKAIKDVKPGEMVMGADHQGRLTPTRVSRLFVNGDRPCYRYVFRKGSSRKTESFRELIATEDHEVLAQIRDSQPRKIQTGPRYVSSPLPLRRATFRKDPTRNVYVATPIKRAAITGAVNEHRALLAGLMLGDGNMTTGQYSLSCADSELLTDVKDYLRGLNLELSETDYYTKILKQLTSDNDERQLIAGLWYGYRNKAKQWLRETLGECYAHEKTLPANVYQWDDESVGWLLSGLFATDGCVELRKDGCSLRLRLTSCALVKETQRLLELRLGIWTSALKRIPKEKLDNAINDQHGFEINHPESIRRFAEMVPLVGSKKHLLAKGLKRLSKSPRSHEIGFKVISREFLGLLPTYDLEVEHPDHLFALANGLIVANSVAKAGFLGKQLAQISHRGVVAALDADGDGEPDALRGYPVDVDDNDNEGALLAVAAGPYPRNTTLTPKVLADLRRRGQKKILVRSPIVGGPEDGSLYARDVGVREFGRLPAAGENPAMTAAQSLSEPLSQSLLCLAEGTSVLMADGSHKAIEDVRPGDWVMGADKTGQAFPSRVLNVFDNGERECVRTSFRWLRSIGVDNKIHLESTTDHKILAVTRKSSCSGEVFNGVKRLLPVGEPGKYFAAVLPHQYAPVERGYDNRALLIGLLLGDGCYTESVGATNFSCADPLLVRELQSYLESLNLRLTKLKGHAHYYRFSSITDELDRDPVTGRVLPGLRNPAAVCLAEFGMSGKYAHEKEIPAELFEASTDTVRMLLSGLIITDGTIYLAKNGKPHGGFGSTSLILCDQVRQLLARHFGIYATRIHSQEQGRKRPLYSFTVTQYQAMQKFFASLHMFGDKRLRVESWRNSYSPDIASPYPRCSRVAQEPIGLRRTYDLEVDNEDHLFVLSNYLIVSNSSKHSSGVAGAGAGKTATGFDAINALIQIPKTVKGGAAHAEADGLVSSIADAPAGGKYVTIDGQRHYVAEGFDLKVKPGDRVEAGDVISEGLPDPSLVVKHKGVGEGRRYFVDAFRRAFKDAGLRGHRRNIELLARGLINHVQLTDELGDYAPDDVVPYQAIEAMYQPRDGHRNLDVRSALGNYLEKPYLHYSVGTKVRPSVVKDLQDFGIKHVLAHRDPPPFQPQMVRGMYNLQHDPDWVTRLYGSGLKSSLLDSAHRGGVSDEAGSSFVPGLAKGVNFGYVGKVKTPSPQSDFQDDETRQLKAAADEDWVRQYEALPDMYSLEQNLQGRVRDLTRLAHAGGQFDINSPYNLQLEKAQYQLDTLRDQIYAAEANATKYKLHQRQQQPDVPDDEFGYRHGLLPQARYDELAAARQAIPQRGTNLTQTDDYYAAVGRAKQLEEQLAADERRIAAEYDHFRRTGDSPAMRLAKQEAAQGALANTNPVSRGLNSLVGRTIGGLLKGVSLPVSLVSDAAGESLYNAGSRMNNKLDRVDAEVARRQGGDPYGTATQVVGGLAGMAIPGVNAIEMAAVPGYVMDDADTFNPNAYGGEGYTDETFWMGLRPEERFQMLIDEGTPIEQAAELAMGRHYPGAALDAAAAQQQQIASQPMPQTPPQPATQAPARTPFGQAFSVTKALPVAAGAASQRVLPAATPPRAPAASPAPAPVPQPTAAASQPWTPPRPLPSAQQPAGAGLWFMNTINPGMVNRFRRRDATTAVKPQKPAKPIDPVSPPADLVPG